MAGRRRGKSRREFLRDSARLGAAAWASGGIAFRPAAAEAETSRVFRVDGCPPHDGAMRHVGVDALLGLLAENGVKLYRTPQPHPWGGSSGIIEADDVVLVKVNCQWKCRGTTNTDVVRGLVHRILEHPDGFAGEVVIVENGQGRGGFDGMAGGAVRAFSLVSISAKAYSFQAKIRQKTAVAAIPVTHWGSTILRNACSRL